MTGDMEMRCYLKNITREEDDCKMSGDELGIKGEDEKMEMSVN